MTEAAGAIGLAIGIVIGVIITIALADRNQSKFHKEAVNRNYAEWVVDANGKTKWRWKEVQP